MPTTLTSRFPPTREAARSRLQGFVPKAGSSYAKGRNYDRSEWDQQSVSGLSPYLSRRMLTEQEVVEAVLERHGFHEAEKYLQEVCWRTYWKGWLEQRPEVWTRYVESLPSCRRELERDSYRFRGWEAACAGRTSITAFNHWVEELRSVGYLHNHARMWFAGVWIFDFGLPWQLGADFFYRNLLDRDAASNTLSWRWVAGLQTPGKRYLPSASNIEKYTEGRFDESDTLYLNHHGPEFEGFPPRERLTFPDHDEPAPEILLLHRDDLAMDLPEDWTGNLQQVILIDLPVREDLTSEQVRTFDQQALADAEARWSSCASCRTLTDHEFTTWWRQHAFPSVAMPWAPVGPVRDLLESIWVETGSRPRTLVREWDQQLWPEARSGFFRFWKEASRFLKDRMPTPAGSAP